MISTDQLAQKSDDSLPSGESNTIGRSITRTLTRRGGPGSSKNDPKESMKSHFASVDVVRFMIDNEKDLWTVRLFSPFW